MPMPDPKQPDIARHCPDGHFVADNIDAPVIAFPHNKRPMAGRTAAAIAHPNDGPPLRLSWNRQDAPKGKVWLRLTVAVDHRCLHRVAVVNAATGEAYGICEVPYGCPGQVFEHHLSGAQAKAALSDGLALYLAEPVDPLWIIAPGPNAPDAVLPHLFTECGVASADIFLKLFCSEATLQPCDWMGICVLDGLMDWAALGRPDAKAALYKQLEISFHPETGRRENFKGMPCDGEPGGPESTGPWAVLARVAHNHPALLLAEEGFEKHYDPRTKSVGKRVVAETSYNIAYPMMALARCAGRSHLQERALHQLEVNRSHLTGPDDLWLRYDPGTGERTFQNWSRGVAWYYLGLVRTLTLLPEAERPNPLIEEIGRVATWVARHQQRDGLWPCFLKASGVLPDTSGSAGIAAAIALAVRQGMIPREHNDTARQVAAGLMANLTPDGWLRGVSQSNKRETHHMDIQRCNHRIIAPWGMGLLAQLLAALDRRL